MNESQASAFCRWLEANRFSYWITGGWGIDALLGRETRRHKDLDLLVRLADIVRLRQCLGAEGYVLKELWSEDAVVVDPMGNATSTAFVLQNREGLEVDLHALRFDEQGIGVPAWNCDEGYVFGPNELGGEGIIGSIPVRCLSPQTQMQCHVGYPLPEYQRRDLILIHKAHGIAYSAELAHLSETREHELRL